MRRELPSGTVTFLFTDVEGSTKLLHELGPESYAETLLEHRRLVREAVARHGGAEVDTQGDAFFFAFSSAPGALDAAAEAQDALAAGPIQVRMGIHTGTPLLVEHGYVGPDVHRAARIAACGHGGQVLLSAATAGLVDSGLLRDLAEHRLKDLSAPERIYQFGERDFAPLTSLYQTNLPVPSTPFLGRKRELAEVVELLWRKDVRLLTLTGPGGTGKTRLAAHAGGLASDEYPDGVWWVSLAVLRDPGLVLETAAQALGATDGLAAHIGGKHLLVLFDNFEQVAGAAGGLAEVLAVCPNLDLLVTSREPLHLTAEQEYPVPPFAHEEGIGFFVARAQAVRPDFQADGAVSEICRRLDELPLALELAAARVKALSPQQILDRLEQRLPLLTGGARDMPERQRTLRATIEWSYELLSEAEQRLFARLAVFAGGCTLEAAEEICDADVDTLQSLVDKSLLRLSDDRFWMLETIREFALERFDESAGAEVASERHANAFLALAEQAEPELTGSAAGPWFRRLDAELGNLRQALEWFRRHDRAELELRLAAAVHRFWFARGHLKEGLDYLEGALARSSRKPTALRVNALHGAYRLAGARGEHERAERVCEERLVLCRELGDPHLLAAALRGLSNAVGARGNLERAVRLQEESLALAREVGDALAVEMALGNLATFALQDARYEDALALAEESLTRARELGNLRDAAFSLEVIGLVALRQGRSESARPPLREGLELARELGDRPTVAALLEVLAAVAVAGGAAAAASRILSAGAALREEFGIALDRVEQTVHDETVDAARSALGKEAFAAIWHDGQRLSFEEAVNYALEHTG